VFIRCAGGFDAKSTPHAQQEAHVAAGGFRLAWKTDTAMQIAEDCMSREIDLPDDDNIQMQGTVQNTLPG
jgi:hypothetical protein